MTSTAAPTGHSYPRAAGVSCSCRLWAVRKGIVWARAGSLPRLRGGPPWSARSTSPSRSSGFEGRRTHRRLSHHTGQAAGMLSGVVVSAPMLSQPNPSSVPVSPHAFCSSEDGPSTAITLRSMGLSTIPQSGLAPSVRPFSLMWHSVGGIQTSQLLSAAHLAPSDYDTPVRSALRNKCCPSRKRPLFGDLLLGAEAHTKITRMILMIKRDMS